MRGAPSESVVNITALVSNAQRNEKMLPEDAERDCISTTRSCSWVMLEIITHANTKCCPRKLSEIASPRKNLLLEYSITVSVFCASFLVMYNYRISRSN